MKRPTFYQVLYAVSIVLVLCFILFFGVDVCNYHAYLGSFPLYTYAVIRGIFFLIPSMIVFVVALFVQIKSNKK